MADDSLTHKDLAQALGVSETTIKSYRRKFPGCLPVVSRGKPLRFDPKAMEVCRAIREGFGKGMPVEDLRRRLAAAFDWCAPRRDAAGHSQGQGDGPGTGPGGNVPAAETPDAAPAELAAAVRALVAAQQGVMDRLASMEDRLTAMDGRLADLAGSAHPAHQTAQAAQVPGAATPSGPDKVVRIRTRQGSVERYGLSRMPEAPDANASGGDAPGADAPPAAFMALPMVIRSASGEFLGIAGREGHLSVEGFMERMRRRAGAGSPLPVRWERLDEAWVMHLEGAGEGAGNGVAGGSVVPTHTLHLEGTTTPRGNEVVWLKTMLVADDVMPDTFLHDFLRRLRKDFD